MTVLFYRYCMWCSGNFR